MAQRSLQTYKAWSTGKKTKGKRERHPQQNTKVGFRWGGSLIAKYRQQWWSAAVEIGEETGENLHEHTTILTKLAVKHGRARKERTQIEGEKTPLRRGGGGGGRSP
jgi:hypothetical protein